MNSLRGVPLERAQSELEGPTNSTLRVQSACVQSLFAAWMSGDFRSAAGSIRDEEVFDDVGLDQRRSVSTPQLEVVAGNISVERTVPHDVGLEQLDAGVAMPGRTLGPQASTRQLQQAMEVGHDVGRQHQDAMRWWFLEVVMVLGRRVAARGEKEEFDDVG
jgi:hypothetical protein